MSGWMYGWMDVAYSLRHWFSLSNHPYLFFLWDMATPFSSLFFWVMFLCHAIFSLFGQPISNFILFQGCSTRELPKHGAFINERAQLYLPYLYSQRFRLGSSICNPRNFEVHWQGIYITNRFKLKRTLIFKLGTIDMVEQSKTHLLNLS